MSATTNLSMKTISRRKWLLFGQTIFGIVLLAVWLRAVDLAAISELLRSAQWGIVIIAMSLAIASKLVRAARWGLLLRPIANVPRKEIWLISMASSLLNFVIPIRSGEVARSVLLKKRHAVRISKSLPTIAVDRSLDLFALIVIAAAGLLTGLRIGTSLTVVVAIGAGLLFGFTVLILLAVFWQERLMQLTRLLLPSFISCKNRDRMVVMLDGLLTGFTAIGRQPRNLPALIGLAFLVVLLDAGFYYLLFASVGNPVAPLVALTGYALFALTFLIPGAPGHLGSAEAFGSLIFAGLMGIPQTTSASVVLMAHGLSALLLGTLGGAAIWHLGFRPQQELESADVLQSTVEIPSSEPEPRLEAKANSG